MANGVLLQPGLFMQLGRCWWWCGCTLHGSDVTNLQIEADTKAKVDLRQSSLRARGQGKELSPCCPPEHQEDLSVGSDVFLATSPSSLAEALVSALVLRREPRTSV